MAHREFILSTCPTCLPDVKGAYFSREVDDDLKPCWKCNNCGHEKKRQVRTRGTGRTRSQQRLVDYLPGRILEAHTYGDADNYEIKRLDVTDHDWGMTSIVIEVGRKGDEGTVGSIICRDYRHIFIGRSGGLQLVNAKHKAKSRGRFNVVHGLTR